MATVTLLASDGLSSASTTITSTATITAAVGDWLLVAIAANNRAADGSSHWADTISDSDGINTYITRASVNYNPAGTNTGATVILVTAAVTDALANATISMTWDTAAFGAGAYQVFRIHPGAGEAISFVAADTTGSTGAATLHSAATVPVALGNMIFGAAAIETNISITGDTDTSNGSWSALSRDFYPNATDTLGMTSVVQWKTVTGAGNQSWSCSTTSAKDSARTYLVLHLVSAAYSLTALDGAYSLSGTAVTPRLGHAPLVASTGSYALAGTAASLSLGGANKVLGTDVGSYSLAGPDALATHGYFSPAAAGSYSLGGTAVTLTAGAATSYALTGTTVTASLGFKAAAEAGSYALAGSSVVLSKTTGLGKVIGPDAGVYSLAGSDGAVLHGWRVVAGEGTIGDLLLESGDILLLEEVAGFLLEIGDNLVLESGTNLLLEDIPSSALDLEQAAGAGSFYELSGTNQPLLHGWVVHAGFGDELQTEDDQPLDQETDAALLEEVQAAYQLDGQDVLLLSTGDKFVVAESGAYALAGTAAALTLVPVSKVLVAEAGSYLLAGSDVTLTSSAQPAASPLHIGEWPLDKRRRRRREDAVAAEQRARKRFRDAIGRLLEGLPPEFDEPADLDEALDSAVQASNLLYALSAPIREINAVNDLIDHIRQLRIAQPIAQLHLAQAYSQAHRHLRAKAEEDAAVALLFGFN